MVIAVERVPGTVDVMSAEDDPPTVAAKRTPERQHVGRSGLPGRVVESGFRWRPGSEVPGAELSAEARERIRQKDESSRRARARAMIEASTYVIGGR